MIWNVVINIRAASSIVTLIDRAAAVEGKTRSAFLRDCAERSARSVFPTEVGDPIIRLTPQPTRDMS